MSEIIYSGKSKRQKLTIIILCILLFIATIVNVILTYAYFSDKAISDDAIIQIGTVVINASILEDDGVLRFDDNEVTAGSSTTKTLILSVPTGSADCYVRLYAVFKIDGAVVNDILEFNIGASASSNWTTDSSNGYLYYNSYFSSSMGQTNIPLTFSISEDFGNVSPTDPSEIYVGKPYTITLYVDAIQKANDAGQYWTNPTPPASWISIITA